MRFPRLREHLETEKGPGPRGVIALVGTTNVGKSTLFNVLTGEKVRVSNWPGTTVMRKEGVGRIDGEKYVFIDLPGIHGYYGVSLDESISKTYLLRGDYSLALAIGDYSELVRSLYSVILVIETFPRSIVVINKADLVDRELVEKFDEYLSRELGRRVVSISAIREAGLERLKREIEEAVREKEISKEIDIDYDRLNPYIDEIVGVLSRYPIDRSRFSLRGLAVNLLAEDPDIESFVAGILSQEDFRRVIETRVRARREIGRDITELVISARYRYVESLIRRSPLAGLFTEERVEKTWVDRVIEAPMGSVALLLGVIFSLFFTVFVINTGFPLNIIFSVLGLENIASVLEEYSLSGILSMLFGLLADTVRTLMSSYPEPLVGLITDGVIAGVGSVVTFLPLIFLVSLGFAVLEDSGVATRLAVGLHRTFSRFGFSGRYVYPLLVSLGCNVPGVLLSRGALDSRERLAQILSTPFVPCQARLVVALAVSQALFPGEPVLQALLILSVYIVGIATSLVSGYMVRRLVIRERYSPELIIDLPRLHRPYARVVSWISWSYTREFLLKAGIVIFLLSIVTWFLTSFGPSGYVSEFSESYGYMIGSSVAVFLEPLNISREVGPLIGYTLLQGFVAKEGLLSSLAIIRDTEDPVEAISSLGLSAPQTIAILFLAMLYVPCMATLSVIYQETRSLRWTLFSIVYMLTIAYVLSLTIYYMSLLVIR